MTGIQAKRCPTCGRGLLVIVATDLNDSQSYQVSVRCEDGGCDYQVYPGCELSDYAQFFE